MSWSDYVFDSDYKQRRDLLKQRDEIDSLNHSLYARSDKLALRIKQLEHENAEIKLVCLTLLRTLINHDLITEEGFIQLSQQVNAETEAQHGRSEGRILPKPEPPPKQDIKIDFSSARQKPKSFDL